MTFSQSVKDEIASKKQIKPCCAKAASYGIACFAKTFNAEGLVFQTELEETARYVRRIYQKCDIVGELTGPEENGGDFWQFRVQQPQQVKAMLELFQCTGKEVSIRIDPKMFECAACVQAFAGAAFLSCGTVADPNKSFSMEFNISRYNLARDFEALLGEHEFTPHRIRRRASNIVYIKASDAIVDMLAFSGASNAALRMIEIKIMRNAANRANRLTNCETANMGKTAVANVTAAKNIELLEQQGVLDTLPAALQETVRLRKENPEASLAELAELCVPPISKSGMAHRMKKIEKLADELKRRMQENPIDG